MGWFFETDKDGGRDSSRGRGSSSGSGSDSGSGSGSGSGSDADDARFERYVAGLNAAGVVPNVTGLYSAHQMGSCRMAARAGEGPVRPSGETYECAALFVADASTFPTSVGCVARLSPHSLPLLRLFLSPPDLCGVRSGLAWMAGAPRLTP